MKNTSNVNTANIENNTEMKGEKKMNHLMSVLGTNNYQSATYQWETAEAAGSAKEEVMHRYTGRFVQIASLMKVLEEHPDTDIRVSIFLTQKARENNWEDHMETGTKGLGSELRTFADGHPEREIRIETVEIPAGKNKKEQDEIFDAMFRNIEDGETVYFDVTHGFRSIPMLALTIVNYARAVKNAQVGGLYYGAFDAKDEETGHVPLFDMTYCDSILQWTGAAESFISSGSSKQVKDLYMKEKVYSDNKMKCVVEGLNDLTNCLETSRGSVNENSASNKSIRSAYRKFEEAYGALKISGEMGRHQKPMTELFGVIEKDVAIFDAKIIDKKTGNELPNTAIGVAAVRWAIEKGLVQQGLTALEATITTYIGEKNGMNISDKDYRTLMANMLESLAKAEGDKAAARQEFRSYSPNVTAVRKAASKRRVQTGEVWDELLTLIPATRNRLAYCRRDVATARNSINHFGISDPVSYVRLRNSLIREFNVFADIIAKDCRTDDRHGSITEWKAAL